MKTFALVVYLFFADGSKHTFVEDSGLSAAECATQLVLLTHDGLPTPVRPFKGGRKIETAIVACEEEIGA